MCCLKCNAEIRNDTNFCPFCGTRVVRLEERELLSQRLRELDADIEQQEKRLDDQKREYEAELQILDKEIDAQNQRMEEICKKALDTELTENPEEKEKEQFQGQSAEKRCPKCGTIVGINDKFCGVCGCNL